MGAAIADTDTPDRLQPLAQSRQRAHVRGGGAEGEADQDHPRADGAFADAIPRAPRASAGQDHAHPEEEAAHHVRGPAEGPQRHLDETERQEQLHADDGDEEREHVGAHDARVAHEDDVGDGAGEAEASALYARIRRRGR